MQSVVELIQSYPDLAQTIGVIGFMIYISCFFSVQSGKLCGNGILFPTLQVIAAICVLTSLASAYNLASFMIQTSYIAIGLFGIALRLRRVRTNRKTNAETTSPSRMRAPIRFDADCHEPATLFRHSTDQSESPKAHSLYP